MRFRKFVHEKHLVEVKAHLKKIFVTKQGKLLIMRCGSDSNPTPP